MRKHWPLLLMLGPLLAAGGAHAQQNYPTKPIRLVVPFPAGGSTDIMARRISRILGESFRKTIVVDNRPGGGGTLGTEIVVRATPDGYTLLNVSAAYAANAALYKLPYDPLHGVTPIALIGETGFVVAANPSGPFRSIPELIAQDQSNPGKLNYGTGGTGSSVHLATELFNQMAGTKLTHVPYRGTGAAMTDLITGQIHVVFGSMPQTIPQVKAKRLRAIAVTTARRADAVPEIPTVAESVPGYEAVNWSALLGPKSLPKPIAARWNKEINGILQLPEVKESLAASGMDPVGGSPERFAQVLRRDVAKWQKVVATAHIKPGR